MCSAREFAVASAEVKAERVRLGGDLSETVAAIESRIGKKRMVLVAAGDPLFYGVAQYLCEKLGKDRFEVLRTSAACSSPSPG